MICIVVSGCNSSNSGNALSGSGESDPVSIPITIAKAVSGGVQKGQFIQGSTVEAQELNADLEAIGTFYSTSISDHLGHFDLSDTISADYIEIISSGYYFNEVAGEVTSSPLTLRCLSDISSEDATIMVNALTTLDGDRIEYLMSNTSEITVTGESTTFSNARKQAEQEILNQVFGIETTDINDIDNLKNFNSMDITETGESNAILLAASVILQGNRSVSELSEMISQISTDMADGTLGSDTLKSKLRENQSCLIPEQIRENLNNRYADLGVTEDIPDFEDYLDPDGDGTLNKEDNTSPTISSVSPVANATNVSVNTAVQVVFSEHIGVIIDTDNFTLTKSNNQSVSGTISYDCATKTATFTPAENLAFQTTYTAKLFDTITDSAGNYLAENYSWDFSVGETVSPEASALSPVDNATGVSILADVIVTFDEDIKEDTLDGAFYLKQGANLITSVITYNSSNYKATLNPSSVLSRNTTYTATVTNAVTDYWDNPLAQTYSWEFKTINPGKTLTKTISFSGAINGNRSALAVGDINGDGTLDFVFGDKKFNSDTGRVVIYSGDDWSTLRTHNGAEIDTFYGSAVASLGDINSDNKDDYVIGAYRADNEGVMNSVGSVTVYSGVDGTILHATKYGTIVSGQYGGAVANAGDVNKDGINDYIVGAPINNAGVGSIYVYSGADGTTLYQKNGTDGASTFFGYSVSTAGDINKDGYDDFIAGTPSAGNAYVFSGADGTLLHTQDYSGASYFGDDVAMVGDINQDGYDDYMVGADTNEPPTVYIFSGKNGSEIDRLDDGDVGSRYGYNIAYGGDMDGDGIGDIIVGAPIANSSNGLIYVYSGLDRTLLYNVYSNYTDSEKGTKIVGNFDFNNDGLMDFAVTSTGTTTSYIEIYLSTN